MADPAQDLWVERVLGMTLPGRTSQAGLEQKMHAWRAAIESVDAQIARLQSALRANQDESLQKIAEVGLNAVTGGHKVRLMAALQDANNGSNSANLAKIAGSFRLHLEKDARVAACDHNPFGVAVTIRATLTPVLQELERV